MSTVELRRSTNSCARSRPSDASESAAFRPSARAVTACRAQLISTPDRCGSRANRVCEVWRIRERLRKNAAIRAAVISSGRQVGVVTRPPPPESVVRRRGHLQSLKSCDRFDAGRPRPRPRRAHWHTRRPRCRRSAASHPRCLDARSPTTPCRTPAPTLGSHASCRVPTSARRRAMPGRRPPVRWPRRA